MNWKNRVRSVFYSLKHSILKKFALFWYRFPVGDDWPGAFVIIGEFAATFWLVKINMPADWLLPAAVLFGVALSLYRVSSGTYG
jgi:hypothetical protein